MEAIAFIPVSSPPSGQINGTVQATGKGTESTFAPALSKAISNRTGANGRTSGKSSSKTPNHSRNTTDAKGTSQSSNKSNSTGNVTNSDEATDIASSGNTGTLSKTDERQNTPGAQKTTDTSPANETAESKKIKSGKFILGLLGYLFSIQKNLTASNLTEEAKKLSDKFGIGSQESINILRNFSSLAMDRSSESQLIGSLASTTDGNTMLQKLFDALSSDSTSEGQKSTQALVDSILQKTAAGTDSDSNATKGTASDDTQKQSLIAQQLQKILAADNGEKPIKIQLLSPKQNQTNGLDALSSPLYGIAGKQTQDADPIALQSSLVKGASADGKNTDMHSTKLDELQNHAFVVKLDESDQKEAGKVQAKDAGLQDAEGRKQANMLDAMSSKDAAGNAQQTGQQVSFASTLAQGLQTGQHTTGVSTTPHYFTWTPAHENAFVNQVIQRFNINPNSPTSKMVMKLYPEELGELKIDIQMKDGVIKASFVAQTQQVQQVLEKYIPKLRTFMEQQGLTVDDILVTTTSDNVGGHDLFQEDFVDNNGFSPPEKSLNQAPLPDIAFENAFSEKKDVVSGVNVTV